MLEASAGRCTGGVVAGQGQQVHHQHLIMVVVKMVGSEQRFGGLLWGAEMRLLWQAWG